MSCFVPFPVLLTISFRFTSDSRREEARQKGIELLQSGDKRGASDCFQRAVDVTPRMAFNLIELLRKEGVEFMVAPYEADAQLTFLCLNGFVDAVISEDSDLVPYGCPRMIYKLDKDGNGKEVLFADLGSVTEVDLSRFSAEMLRHMCILSGCDYLESLPGMGLKKAHALLARHGSMGEVFKILETSKLAVPADYALNFGRADLTFQHQIVYDPKSRKTVHLHPLPDHVDPSTLPFAGEHLEDTVAQLVAEGRLDPHTYEPFILSIPISLPPKNARNGLENATAPHASTSSSTLPHPSPNMTIGHRDRVSPTYTQMQVSSTKEESNFGTHSPASTSQLTSQSPSSSQLQGKRISTQWQTKATSPLTAIRQSLASGISGQPQTLSADEICKHDNDITRDVRRYTMFRGSGKGVKSAASTASKIISSSSPSTPAGKPSHNNIHAYFQPATSSPTIGVGKSIIEGHTSPFRTRTSPSSAASASTPTKLSTTSPSSNSIQSMQSPTAKTVFKSRFFASSTPDALVDTPDQSSSLLKDSPLYTKPVENLASYLAVWGEEQDDEDCLIIDEALETIITTGTRPPSITKTPTRTDEPIASDMTSEETKPLDRLPGPSADIQSPSTTSTPFERHSVGDSTAIIEDKWEYLPQPSAKRHVPVRFSLPMKAYNMSLNNDDSDEEIELLRVNSGSVQSMGSKQNDLPPFDRSPIIPPKFEPHSPLMTKSSTILSSVQEDNGPLKFKIEVTDDCSGLPSSSTSRHRTNSSNLLAASSTSLVVPLSDSASIFDEMDRLEERPSSSSLDRSVSDGDLFYLHKGSALDYGMILSKDDWDLQSKRTQRMSESELQPPLSSSTANDPRVSSTSSSFRNSSSISSSSTSTLLYGSAAVSQLTESSSRIATSSATTVAAPTSSIPEKTPSPNLKKRSRYEDRGSDAMLETSPPIKVRVLQEVDIFNLID